MPRKAQPPGQQSQPKLKVMPPQQSGPQKPLLNQVQPRQMQQQQHGKEQENDQKAKPVPPRIVTPKQGEKSPGSAGAKLQLPPQAQKKREIEENRRRLVEACGKKPVEHLQPLNQFAPVQEDTAAADASREEARAMAVVRGVIQKMRKATPENFEDLVKELLDVIRDELDNCGAQMEAIKEESDLALREAEECLLSQEEKDRKREESFKELMNFVEITEEAAKSFEHHTGIFSGDGDLTREEVKSAISTAETSCARAEENMEAFTAYVAKNGAMLKRLAPPPPAGGAEEEGGKAAQPTIQEMTKKMAELKRKVDFVSKKANKAAMRACYKAELRSRSAMAKDTFAKYDTNKDGALSRSELLNYAKGEYGLHIPSEDADSILRLLAKDSEERGVPMEAFESLRISVGIIRENARDKRRRVDRLMRERAVEDQKIAEEKERVAREKAAAEKKASMVARVEATIKTVAEADASTRKLETVCKHLPGKSKKMPAVELDAEVKDAEAMIEATQASLSQAWVMTEALLADNSGAEDSVNSEAAGLNGEIKNVGGRLSMLVEVVEKVREDATRKLVEEMNTLYVAAVKMIRFHRRSQGYTQEELFKDIDSKNDGEIDEDEFANFLTRCDKEDGMKKSVPKEDANRMFAVVKKECSGKVTPEAFLGVSRVFMLVTKDTLLTNGKSIKESSTIRRIELGEVAEVISGPTIDESADVPRVRVLLLGDSKEGWVTPVGNIGTLFLEERDIVMKVVKETAVTRSFDEVVPTDSTSPTLRKGEIVEVREWMRKHEGSGATRVKVWANKDGRSGWATVEDREGVVFLAPA
eukprot:TRINITY_DN26704_c0_g1_i3.p1 TRINITY_DN26704_c0_g1~~TRINITY_DN26704_c0_g1_i3.p1  ORF type:complete len:816 (+),score=244.37 TRINITY_DN26704_c0_g1_i3:303-2750(+)